MASANPLLNMRIGACTNGIRCDVGGLADFTPGVTYLMSLEMYPDGCDATICQNCHNERSVVYDAVMQVCHDVGITFEEYCRNIAIEARRGQEQAARIAHFGGAAAVVQRGAVHFGGAAAIFQRDAISSSSEDEENDPVMSEVLKESEMLAKTYDTRMTAKVLEQIELERKNQLAAELPESGSFCTSCGLYPPFSGFGSFNLTDGEPICLNCYTNRIEENMSGKPVVLFCNGCGMKYPTSSTKCHSMSCMDGSSFSEVSQCSICQDLKRYKMNPLVTDTVIGRNGCKRVLCGPVCCNDCRAEALQSFFASLPPL